MIFFCLLALSACSDRNQSNGLDLSNVKQIDQLYFTNIYNQCNNSQYDCNCVARLNLDHRDTLKSDYKANYQSIHKPALIAEIATLSATIADKIKNSSDERIIENLEENLDELHQHLGLGANSIDDVQVPLLATDALDQCLRK